MVAQCAGCNVYQPWAALIIGIFGGFAFMGGHFLMLRLKFDDPLDAVAVHGFGGTKSARKIWSLNLFIL